MISRSLSTPGLPRLRGPPRATAMPLARLLFFALLGCLGLVHDPGQGDAAAPPAGPTLARARVPAFPGAEGAGAWTPGGRGGKVFVVTSLEDKGKGSLREAVEAKGPRMVVFAVAGIISLESPLAI